MDIGSILPVGTVIHSMLSTTQFASEYGDNWVLADGRNVSGTKYHSVTGSTTVPDMRGRFLRGKGVNNPDGDLSLGAYTADKVGPHVHNVTIAVKGAFGGSSFGNNTNASTQVYVTDPNTGNETAPKSITVNIFIRIN